MQQLTNLTKPLQPCSHDCKAAKKTRRRKETRTVHFKIIISLDWLHRIGYFLGYELVERFEVCHTLLVNNKQRLCMFCNLI